MAGNQQSGQSKTKNPKSESKRRLHVFLLLITVENTPFLVKLPACMKFIALCIK